MRLRAIWMVRPTAASSGSCSGVIFLAYSLLAMTILARYSISFSRSWFIKLSTSSSITSTSFGSALSMPPRISSSLTFKFLTFPWPSSSLKHSSCLRSCDACFRYNYTTSSTFVFSTLCCWNLSYRKLTLSSKSFTAFFLMLLF